jgi:hypothetical protein
MLSEEDFPDELDERAPVPDDELVVSRNSPSSKCTTPDACGATTAANNPTRRVASAAAAGRGRLPNIGPRSAD